MAQNTPSIIEVMDAHLEDIERTVKNSLQHFEVIDCKIDKHFLDLFTKKTIERLNQTCAQYATSVVATTSHVSTTSPSPSKRRSTRATPIAKRQKVIHFEVTSDESSAEAEPSLPTPSTSSPKKISDDDKGEKYLQIIGINELMLKDANFAKDELKRRQIFDKLCQTLRVDTTWSALQKIYVSVKAKPYSMIVMMKEANVRNDILEKAKKIPVWTNDLYKLNATEHPGKILIEPYKIPGMIKSPGFLKAKPTRKSTR